MSTPTTRAEAVREYGHLMFREGLSPAEMELAARVGTFLWRVSNRRPDRSVRVVGEVEGREVLDLTSKSLDAGVPVIKALRLLAIEADAADVPVDTLRVNVVERFKGVLYGADAWLPVGSILGVPHILLSHRSVGLRPIRLQDALNLPMVEDLVADVLRKIDDAILGAAGFGGAP